jgi:hypothetical protein
MWSSVAASRNRRRAWRKGDPGKAHRNIARRPRAAPGNILSKTQDLPRFQILRSLRDLRMTLLAATHAQDAKCAFGLFAPDFAAIGVSVSLVIQLAVVRRTSEHVAWRGTELLELRAELIEQVPLTLEALKDAFLRISIRVVELHETLVTVRARVRQEFLHDLFAVASVV